MLTVNVRTELPEELNSHTTRSVVLLATRDQLRLPAALTPEEAELLACELQQAAKECRDREAGWEPIRPWLPVLAKGAVALMQHLSADQRFVLTQACVNGGEFELLEIDPLELNPWQAVLADRPDVSLGFYPDAAAGIAAGQSVGLKYRKAVPL